MSPGPHEAPALSQFEMNDIKVAPSAPKPEKGRTSVVFALALAVYLVTWRGHVHGWHRIIKPSPQNLYVHQAYAWLDGHLDLRTVGKWNDVTPLGDERHVSFPPAPAVLLIPLVAVFGLDPPDMLFQVLMGALCVTLMYRALWACNRRLGIEAKGTTIELLTGLYALGTQLWIAVAWEHVSFCAHMVSLAALSAALWAAAERRGLWAGLAFGVAIASRQAMIGAGPFVALLLTERGASVADSGRGRALLLGAIGPLLSIGLMAWHNHTRFGSPLDFGYERLMLADPEHEIKSPHGLFSLNYLPRNAWLFFVQPPKYRPLFPWFHSRPEGMAIWFLTPAFLILLLPRLRHPAGRPCPPRWAWVCWACVAATLVPSLLHHYGGAVQWGCRFLLDVHPLVMVLLLARVAPVPRVWQLVLMGLSVVFTFDGVFVKHLRWFFPQMVI